MIEVVYPPQGALRESEKGLPQQGSPISSGADLNSRATPLAHELAELLNAEVIPSLVSPAALTSVTVVV